MTAPSRLRPALRLALATLAGAFAAAFALYVAAALDRPPLRPWHREAPPSEFRAGRASDFAGYLALEEQAIGEARRISASGEGDEAALDRWREGKRHELAQQLGRDWSRSVRISAAAPVGGVLMLHGLSDSPYSQRGIAERLAARGWEVLVPRMPGHGTVPAGLVELEPDDLAGAARLALVDLANRVEPGKPLLVVGYSTGATLALELAFAGGRDGLPRLDGVLLLSPALAVTPAAGLAAWQARLALLPGLRKLAWESILPEFDPWKYQSFAVRAGGLIHQLVNRLEAEVDRAAGSRVPFPPVLAVASATDDTVDMRAGLSRIFARLPGSRHELVLIDRNRHVGLAPIVSPGAGALAGELMGSATPYAFSVLTNSSSERLDLVERRREAGATTTTTTALPLAWPADVTSLAHVSIPFPADDPIYGLDGDSLFGRLTPRGERKVIVIPAPHVLRLRCNPFFADLAARVERFADDTAIRKRRAP